MVNEALEVAQRVFTAHHQLALVVVAGAQPALDRLAEDDILLLHLVDEAHEVALLLLADLIREAVLVDRQRVTLVYRNDQVERDVAGTRIDVEREIGPEVGVEARLDA